MLQTNTTRARVTRTGMALTVVIFGLIAPLHLARGLAAETSVLINALHYHGREAANDEAIQLINVGAEPVTLDEAWSLSAPFGASTRALHFTGQTLEPGATAWIAHDAAAFSRQFGFSPTLRFSELTGGALSLANGGGWVALTHVDAVAPVDTLVYGTGVPQLGWAGPALQPYVVTGTISADAQILLRRRDPQSGMPEPDTDSAADWLNQRGPALNQNLPIYPGWRIEQIGAPAITGSGALTLAIAPDAGFVLAAAMFRSAQYSIDLESFTFDNVALGEVLAERAAAGVRVRLLLDGAPVGGLSDQTRWICQRLHSAANSGCWFMQSTPALKIAARYRYLHAKFALIDDAQLLVGSENFGINGMPDDDKRDGTLGHRGVLAQTDAIEVVRNARALFDHDFGAPARDVLPWCASGCAFGPPPATYAPITQTGGVSYAVRYPTPLALAGPISLALSTSPENHLANSGVLALLDAAGAGDEILVQQLDEPWHWGNAAATREYAPNPRIEKLIAAAARGATVRVMLDAGYDRASDPLSNAVTAAFLNGLRLPGLRAAVGNPTGAGIHNKMLLARIAGRAYAHIGSWNGSEVSAKLNREVSLLIESDPAHAYLRAMFLADFQLTQPVYLPVVANMRDVANHVLISELMINPYGNDLESEWIEIYNPTAHPISLGDLRIGDAMARSAGAASSDGEGMYHFPITATLPAGGVAVIAQNGLVFRHTYGRPADFEIGAYDPEVPDLRKDTFWSTGALNLGNDGDEVALLQSDDTIIEVVTWLEGSAENTTPFDGSISAGTTLQRWPQNSDTDNCGVDFRAQDVPSVGTVP